MKKNVRNLGLVVVASLLWASCSKDDTNGDLNPVGNGPKVVKAEDFKKLEDNALKSMIQTFSMAADETEKTFVSEKGVIITVNRDDLEINGEPATGELEFELIEIFKGGAMAVSGMHTMGLREDGKMGVLESGGELRFIGKAKSGEAKCNLKAGAVINVQIPTELTGEAQLDMKLWDFREDIAVEGLAERKEGWDVKKNERVGVDGKEGQLSYYFPLKDFGWTNVDRFYSDPREKTQILVAPPTTYDNTNSAVYLHYDGMGNALARLDTFDTATNLFSEHYGLIPVGLACHIIFVTEANGQWRYGIKGVTIAANATYGFTLAETQTATQAQVEAAINALP
jgi:hypothetical protein